MPVLGTLTPLPSFIERYAGEFDPGDALLNQTFWVLPLLHLQYGVRRVC